MKQHSKAYEQYCWVLKKNIVIEETVYHNGTKSMRCTNISDCQKCGGCKNGILSCLWDKKVKIAANINSGSVFTID